MTGTDGTSKQKKRLELPGGSSLFVLNSHSGDHRAEAAANVNFTLLLHRGLDSTLLDRSRSGVATLLHRSRTTLLHRGVIAALLHRASGVTTTAAVVGAVAARTVATMVTAVATIATVATIVAMATIAAVAAIMVTVATVTTMATMTAVATGVTVATSVITRAPVAATMAGTGFLLTAHQGQSDDREEHRDPKQQSAIHVHSSKKLTGTGK